MNAQTFTSAELDRERMRSGNRGDRTSLTVIVGGRGAVGQMLQRELGASLGRTVSVDQRAGRAAADVISPSRAVRAVLARADTVILAVHEPVAIAALPQMMELLAPDCLLVETLSVQTGFAGAIAESRPPFEVLGINPMFGPSLGMAGRAVAVIPIATGPRASAFTSMIAAHGARVTELSAQAHDQAAAFIQALPHLLVLAFARALTDCELDLDTALSIAPPPASVLIALAARIAAGNAQVYSDIQAANPFAAPARAALGRAARDVVASSTCTDALAELLDQLTAAMGDSHPELLRSAAHLIRDQRPLRGARGGVLRRL